MSRRVAPRGSESLVAKFWAKFRAKRRHKGWGIGLTAFGILGVIGGIRSIGDAIGGDPDANPAGVVLFSVVLAAAGVYLLRGAAPADTAVPSSLPQRPSNVAASAVAASTIDAAVEALAAAAPGADAFVAYRNLEATVQRTAGAHARERLDEEVRRIGFDTASVESPRLGHLASLEGGRVEVFRDWVVYGQEAHDFDRGTRVAVESAGSVQVTSNVVRDARGVERLVSQEHDTRTAHFQFLGDGWALTVPIQPDAAPAARAIAGQIQTHVSQLAIAEPKRDQVSSILEAVLANTGQPAAERIRQLDELRYERLLTDDQFEKAKARILGL